MADLCSHEIGFFFRSRIDQVCIIKVLYELTLTTNATIVMQNWTTETLVDKLENKSQNNGNRPES